ncbi:MAG: putative molybdenum carrier protein [bacterium]|nr:putative molybdenum carrier protein [bacterium]
MPIRIISGGQTGADRAALDAAVFLGLDHGGAVPRGRLAEDGPIDPSYDRLIELESADYSVRTEKNVRDADATLLFTMGRMGPGTAFTLHLARRDGKPHLHVDLDGTCPEDAALRVARWLREVRPGVLNVAGSRESQAPGIHLAAYLTLLAALAIHARGAEGGGGTKRPRRR